MAAVPFHHEDDTTGAADGLVVKVSDAKSRLSELIARAERGERVIIARGSTPVIELRALKKRVSPIGVLEKLGVAVDLEEIHNALEEPWSAEDLADFEGALDDELR